MQRYLTDTAMKENPGVMLPLKHDKNEFVSCLIPQFIFFFRVIVVAIEWKDMSPFSINRDIDPAR